MADVWSIFFVIIALVFAGLIGVLIYGLLRPSQKATKTLNGFTIVLPFKNEAGILPQTLAHYKSVLNQNSEVKLWLINDHSSDLNPQLKGLFQTNPQVELFDLPNGLSGKKAAISYAMKHVNTEWVLVVDADAEIPVEILAPDVKIITENSKCVLVPIHPTRRKGKAASFFDLEFLSLHAAGLASAGVGLPLLANGACMFIRRKAYLETLPLRKDFDNPSGDDVFAMFAISKRFGSKSISVLAAADFIARVHFPAEFDRLFSQRLRWVSKTGRIKNLWFSFVSVVVLVSQITLVIGAGFVIKYGWSHEAGVAMVTILGVEIVYLAVAAHKMRRPDLGRIVLPAVFIYPFYLMILLIFSIFAKPKWK